jgi:hypothetical protein
MYIARAVLFYYTVRTCEFPLFFCILQQYYVYFSLYFCILKFLNSVVSFILEIQCIYNMYVNCHVVL